MFFIRDVVATPDEGDGVIRRSLSDLPASFRLYLFSVLLLSIGTVPVAVLLLRVHAVGLTLADTPLFYAVRGSALGLLNAAAGIGALIAGVLAGYLWQASGPATACVVGSIVVVAGLAAFSRVRPAE